MVKTDDWQERIVALKAEDESRTSAQIGEMVGVHQGTVRKVLKRHREEVEAINADIERAALDPKTWETSTNGHGDYPTTATSNTIPGQTTVDEQLRDKHENAGGGDIDAYDSQTFRQEAGEPVGDMPKDPEPDAGEVETRVKGTRQLAIDFGPLAQYPSGGTLVLKSERLASGHFGMGDLISGSFTARVTDVGGRERFDKDLDQFCAKPTAYAATMTEIVWAPEQGSDMAQEVREALAVLKDCGLTGAADLLARLVF